jgi:hypothetical protein
VYYGIFGGIVIACVAIGLLLTARVGRLAVLGRLAAAAAGAAILAAPLYLPYGRAASVVGERSIDHVRPWGATLTDYTHAHPESWIYGRDDQPGEGERRLFPGLAAPALSVAALVPPVGPVVLAYAAAAAVSLNLSLGTNGIGYEQLFRYLPPIRALRVPARFGMAVGLILAVLAGFGVARLVSGRSRRVQLLVVSALSVLASVEGAMRSQVFFALPDQEPAVYRWLAGQSPGVVCEYPVGPLEGRAGPQDPTYMYYSAQHWKPLVNGYSGFAPPSYTQLLAALHGFPDDHSIAYLRERGVAYLLVHEPFYVRGDYAADVAALRARGDVRWVGRFPWKGGRSSDVFVIVRPGGP